MKARRQAIRPRPGATGGWSAAFALLGALILAGCALAPPPETFDLSAPKHGFAARPAKGILVVEEPSGSAPDDSDRVVVRTGRASIAFLKGAQWVDRLPKLIQDRLIDSFENANLVRSAARPTDGLNADYKLFTSIRRFDISAATGEAVVQLSAKLENEHNGRVIAGQIFTGRATGQAGHGASAVHALDQALAQVMRQIVDWSAAHMRGVRRAS